MLRGIRTGREVRAITPADKKPSVERVPTVGVNDARVEDAVVPRKREVPVVSRSGFTRSRSIDREYIPLLRLRPNNRSVTRTTSGHFYATTSNVG